LFETNFNKVLNFVEVNLSTTIKSTMTKNEFQPKPLEANSVYHIFAHSVDNNNLFYDDDNYRFFLKKWEKFSNDFFRTYAFCLMPNHFHLCLQTLPIDNQKLKNSTNANTIEQHPHSKQMSNFLSSYAQSLNKYRERKGVLFRSTFGRVPVSNVTYFKNLVSYVHHNPIHHLGATSFGDWRYSSFNSFKYKGEEEYKFMNTEIPLNRFGGNSEFIDFHEKYRLEKRHTFIQEEVDNYILKFG
jgi:putative transposase